MAIRAVLTAMIAASALATAANDVAAPAPPPGPAGPPPGTDMVPTFVANFDGDALDARVWNTHYGPRIRATTGLGRRSLWSNGEAEVYLDPAFLKLGIDPFRVADGALTITARPLSVAARDALYGELARHPELMHGLKALPRIEYSSGALTTRDVFAQRYGYFEIRARWSADKGLWPAFWLLPADGGWPPELDVVEAHGDKPGTTFQTVHATAAKPAVVVTQSDGWRADFHRYGALWTPERVDFYVDGRKTGSVATPAEMRRPMYLLTNLGVGGYWPGYPDPDPDPRFEATMTVDSIRVWQFRGCEDARKPCSVP